MTTSADPWMRLAEDAVARGALQKPLEFAPLLATAAAEPPRVLIEIGAASGGSLWALCQVAAPDAQVISVDLPGGPWSGGHAAGTDMLEALLQPAQRGTFIRGDSHDPDVRRAVIEALDGPVDLLLIDADHTYDGVRQDFEAYAPLVRENGLVVLHDILPHPRVPTCQVDRFWREIRGRYPHTEHCQPDHDLGWGQWGGIGVIRWRPGS